MPLPRLHTFRPRLLDALKGYSRPRFLADLGAGLTVGVVALPLAMAFAIASGVKPEQGLVTAIVAGLLISALGGSQVQIGGPAGAFIVVVYGILDRYGLPNLLIATSMAGCLLLAMGLARLGGLVRQIPVSIVIGFTNGIAVLIATSQLKDFLGLRLGKLPADFLTQLSLVVRHLDTLNPAALGLAVGCVAIMTVWPKPGTVAAPGSGLPGRLKSRAALVPGTVMALALATVAARGLHLDVETIGSRFGEIPRTLPWPSLPDFHWVTAKELLFPAVTLALLGAIESLLCARVADGLTEMPRHDPDQELMAQGVANFVTPLFGGIPATGTIARTVTNVRAGATSPVAGILHAATVLAVVLVAAPLAMDVPLASLAGVLMVVAWNMGEWHEFVRLRHFNLPYRATLLATFALTVIFDLTVAVEVGLVSACGFFVYRMSTLFHVRPLEVPETPAGVQVFELYGSLFFGAVTRLEELPAAVLPDTRWVVLEMHRLVSMDTSGVDALVQLRRELLRRDVHIALAELNEQPSSLVRRSGFEELLGPGRILERLDGPSLAALAS